MMWTTLKVFIKFVTILFLFYVLIFLATSHVRFELTNQGLNCTAYTGR